MYHTRVRNTMSPRESLLSDRSNPLSPAIPLPFPQRPPSSTPTTARLRRRSKKSSAGLIEFNIKKCFQKSTPPANLCICHTESSRLFLRFQDAPILLRTLYVYRRVVLSLGLWQQGNYLALCCSLQKLCCFSSNSRGLAPQLSILLFSFAAA